MAKSRAESRQQTRNRLLDVARDEFSQRRVNDVTLDEIASKAGFTKGAVYANFSSKSDLLLSVLERRMATHGADYVAFVDESDDDDLADDTGRRAARTGDNDLSYFRLVAAVWAEAVHDPDLADRFRRIRRAHRSRLAESIRRRAVAADLTLVVDADDLAAGLIAMSMATMLEALIDPDLDVGAIHSAIADTILAGVIANSRGARSPADMRQGPPLR